MKIESLYAVNFRNYGNCNLDLPGMINVFFGQNAQGKTNILEAIFYGSFGISHRTSSEEELVKINNNQMAVGIKFSSLTGEHIVKIKKHLHVNSWKKEILLDGFKVRPKEHYGSLNTIMFSPEDLQLVKGEPALRRRFFDMQISQTDPIYYDLLVKYNRVLAQRNKLLKDIRDNDGDLNDLIPWDKEFVYLASAIVKKRLYALNKLQNIVSSIYSSLASSKEEMNIRYELKVNNSQTINPKNDDIFDEDFYSRLLKERNRIDMFRGNTGIGPHRDDLVLLLDDLSLKAYGSQGQHRTGALALKLSQLEYVKNEIGEFPILLLDDVMSELDNSRRNQLLRFIDGKVQTFITVNDRELIPELAGNTYFEISDGSAKEV